MGREEERHSEILCHHELAAHIAVKDMSSNPDETMFLEDLAIQAFSHMHSGQKCSHCFVALKVFLRFLF